MTIKKSAGTKKKKETVVYTDRPSGVCYLEYSEVSCGVKQFHTFYDESEEEWDEELEEYVLSQESGPAPQACFQHLCYRIKESAGTNEPTKLPFATLVFSDVADGPGTAFGDWLSKEFQKGAPARHAALNPNSGRNIVTFMWTPDPAELMTHEIFKNTRVKFGKLNDW